MGTGNKTSNKLNGRMHSASATGRLGVLFEIKTFDPVGDPAPLVLEIFGEGGITAGERHFSKNFKAGGDEYVDNLDEQYRGNIFSGGLNLTTNRGSTFLRYVRTSTLWSEFPGRGKRIP